MAILFYSFIFLFGLIIGSFLNCVIYRLRKNGRGQSSAISGRSYCPHCKHTLSWKDLIPVLSFIILRGKCRYCHKRISWQYPLVETATGVLFLLIFNFQFSIFNQFSNLNFQTILEPLFLLVISCFLIVIFVYDLKHYIIPDKVIYPAIGIAFIFVILNVVKDPASTMGFFAPLRMTMVSALGAAGFFLLIVLVSKGRWMGVGDIKMAFLMGLLLGWPNILVALFVAFILGAIIGLVLIIARKKTLKSEVPFGPFLVSGTFLALFWGEKVINWYLSLFLVK